MYIVKYSFAYIHADTQFDGDGLLSASGNSTFNGTFVRHKHCSAIVVRWMASTVCAIATSHLFEREKAQKENSIENPIIPKFTSIIINYCFQFYCE